MPIKAGQPLRTGGPEGPNPKIKCSQELGQLNLVGSVDKIWDKNAQTERGFLRKPNWDGRRPRSEKRAASTALNHSHRAAHLQLYQPNMSVPSRTNPNGLQVALKALVSVTRYSRRMRFCNLATRCLLSALR